VFKSFARLSDSVACSPLTSAQSASESCGTASDSMLATVENECVYAHYIKREDKDAACVERNMEAALPAGLEFQVEPPEHTLCSV
jgi:tRNA U34 5-carboxymethylaminomethyl modifying enzyme MnmG/GidA